MNEISVKVLNYLLQTGNFELFKKITKNKKFIYLNLEHIKDNWNLDKLIKRGINIKNLNS